MSLPGSHRSPLGKGLKGIFFFSLQYFVFSHSGKYAEAQRQFYMVAKSTEPEGFYVSLFHHIENGL